MQTQEATGTDFLFNLWPWIEANLKRIALVVGAAAIVYFAYAFYSYNTKQKEINAGIAFSKVVTTPGSQPDAFLKVAADFPGTLAGQRALLAGAAELFTAGKYPEAQAQFQKFLDTIPESSFTPDAVLGVAASLDAQGKTDLAITAYQKAAGQTGNASVTMNAKFSLARIYEAQGKAAEAMKLYEDIARTYQNSSLGNEAGLRAMELKLKMPAAPAAKPTAAPLNLGK
jgi:TolA-binding protein